VSPVGYELGFYVPEDSIFIVTAVKSSNLTSASLLALRDAKTKYQSGLLGLLILPIVQMYTNKKPQRFGNWI
jgi:hypothetical protein